MIVLNSPAPAVAVLAVSLLSAACNGGSREDFRPDSRRGSEPASVEERRAVVEKEGHAMPPQRAPGEEAAAPAATGEVPPRAAGFVHR